MHRATLRLAGRLALAGALLLALLAPAAVFAADPTPGASASASQSTDPGANPSASDQVISVDPTFIIAPTATPKGEVLSATGRPEHTLPPTDAMGGTASTGANAQGLLLVLLALVTICLVVAPLPEVRRR